MFDYEEACPVSKAASILCERWTLQIIREMMLGATRFSEFRQYLPKMSPTLLNTRLKTLEENGIIVKKKVPEKKSYEYQLTPSGQALQPLLHEFGKWGMNCAFNYIDPEQLNVAAIVRDFCVALNVRELPRGDSTIQMSVACNSGTYTKFIMVRDSKASMCDENIGYDVDVYLNSDLETLGKIWYGKLSVINACEKDLLKVTGSSYYVNTISRWLGTSQFSVYGKDNAS